MLIKIFTLPFNSVKNRFDDDLLNEFMREHEVLTVRDYLFTRHEEPFLTLVVTYRIPELDESRKKPNQEKAEEDWRELLTDADMGMFSLLREWRGKRSKKDGLPPYILFTNRQLAHIVKAKPQNSNELIKIDGIGEGKIKKYGADILEMTRVQIGDQPAQSPTEQQEQDHDDSGKS